MRIAHKKKSGLRVLPLGQIIQKCDVEAYDFLFQVLQRKGYVGDANRGALNKIANFDLVAWRVEERKLRSVGGHYIGPTDVLHQGIHVLIAERFGHRLKDRPLFTLLNECIGTGLDLYLVANHLAKNDLHLDSFAGPRVRVYNFYSEQFGIPIAKKLNEAIQDPFSAFKQIAEDTFYVQKALYFGLQQEWHQKKKFNFWSYMRQSIKRSPYFVFSCGYVLTVPALSLHAYCGYDTNTEDLKTVEECLGILRSSRSLIEFLSKLANKDDNEGSEVIKIMPLPQSVATNKISNNKRRIRFKMSHLRDKNHLRKGDPEVYDFFLKNIESFNIKIDLDKTWLFDRGGSADSLRDELNCLDWFFDQPAMNFDLPHRTVSSTQMIALSTGLFVQSASRANTKNFPATTLFAIEFSRSLLKYLTDSRKNRKVAYSQFSRDLPKRLNRRHLLFGVGSLKAHGKAIDSEKILSQVRELGARAFWSDSDILISVLAIGARCGFESCKEDRLLLKKYIHIVQDSKTMIECIIRLSVLGGVSKRTSSRNFYPAA